MPTAEQRREYARAWRAANREHLRLYDRQRYKHRAAERKAASRRRYQETYPASRKWLDGVESFLGCFICGEDQPHRLAWHHLTPVGNSGLRVTDALHRYGVEGALEQMKRCVLLCANCHKDVHHWRDDSPHGL